MKQLRQDRLWQGTSHRDRTRDGVFIWLHANRITIDVGEIDSHPVTGAGFGAQAETSNNNPASKKDERFMVSPGNYCLPRPD